jgi:hypothetical protein
MDPRVLEERYAVKRRSGRRLALLAGLCWAVFGVLVLVQPVDGGANIGAGMLMMFTGLPLSLAAIIELSAAHDLQVARRYYR